MFAAFQKYLDGPVELFDPPVTKIQIQEASLHKPSKTSFDLKYFSDCSSELKRIMYTKNFTITGESAAPVSSSDQDNLKMALMTETSIIERKYFVD
jgi:hypothetical protein